MAEEKAKTNEKLTGIAAIAERTLNKMAKLIHLPAVGVVGIHKNEEGPGWVVKVEFVEKKSIPDSMDILGLYEVKVDDSGEILDFNRASMRKRVDLVEQE